MRLDRRRLSY